MIKCVFSIGLISAKKSEQEFLKKIIFFSVLGDFAQAQKKNEGWHHSVQYMSKSFQVSE